MTPGQMQAGLALAAALALHLGAFALHPGPAGAVASGDGGAALVSLEAAPASISSMVAAWDRPPEMAQEAPAPPPAPTLETSVPARPILPTASPTSAPALLILPTLLPPSEAEATPQRQAEAPEAPSEPPPSTRPKPRPDPVAQRPAQTAPQRERAPEQPARRDAQAAAPSTGQAAQRAAGAGGGARAGQGGSSEAGTLSKAAIIDLRAEWGAKIRARIESRKRYPAGAGRATGTVTLRLTISRAGALTGVSVAGPSGHAALDEAALRAVRAAGKFPAAPAGLAEASYSFTLPMTFSR
ncbi:MAG: TonB family protein [Cypionkella sp.]|nr:TonB family protein [Cypionkella sp.]